MKEVKHDETITVVSSTRIKGTDRATEMSILQFTISPDGSADFYTCHGDITYNSLPDFIVSLPGVRNIDKFSKQGKFIAWVELLLHDAKGITCATYESDVEPLMTFVRRIKGRNSEVYRDIKRYVNNNNITEMAEVCGGLKLHNYAQQNFVSTEREADDLARILIDNDGTYQYSCISRSLKRASWFLLEEAARRGYSPQDVIACIASQHEELLRWGEFSEYYIYPSYATK